MSYYLMLGSYAFHILGLLFWLGGLIALSRVLRVFTAVREEGAPDESSVLTHREDLYEAVRMIWFGFVLAGVVLVLVTGLINLSVIGVGYYMREGWFHMKLTAVMLLFGVTAFAGLQMTKLARGEALERKKLALIHGATSALTLCVLLITYFGRGLS
ncbi:CopD family protein [bacterium]|nr:CopD family protein [bacterium]